MRPNAFVEKLGSLANKLWPKDVRIDPNFDSTDRLEWLLENPDDVVVTGLLFWYANLESMQMLCECYRARLLI